MDTIKNLMDQSKSKVFIILLCCIGVYMASCGEKIQEALNTDQTPPVANKDNVSTASNTAVSIDVSLNDTDPGNNLVPTSVTLGSSFGGSCTFSPNAPIVEFTPSIGFSGTGNCSYTICDDAGNCGTGIMEVSVGDTSAPVLVSDFATTSVDTVSAPIDVTVNDNDAEGPLDFSTLTVLSSPAPVGGACIIAPVSPLLKFQPNPSFAGLGSCDYQVCDISGNCATSTLQVDVQDTAAPLPVNDSQTMNSVDPPIIFDPSVNDTDPGMNLDTASVGITFSVGGLCMALTPPSVMFTPDPGFSGTATCGYTICDTNTNCGNAVIAINVIDTSAPTATDDAVTTNSDTPSTAINVASNDSDLEGNLDPSSVSIVSGTNGTCTVSPAPNVVFTPTPGFIGAASCVYQICDNNTPANCSTGTLNASVLDAGAPNAVNDAVTTTSGTAVIVPVDGNDTDPESNLDSSSVTITFAVGGTCAFNAASPNIEFTPNPGFSGLGSCGYSICDNASNCSTAVVQVTVNDTTIPTANNDFASTEAGLPTSPINVSLNDTDTGNNIDITSVTITAAPPATEGSCAVSGAPNVVFTPAAGFTGTSTCTYQICDTTVPANCNTANIEVTVDDTQAPLAVNDLDNIDTVISTITRDVAANDGDAEGNLDDTTVQLTFAVGGVCSFDTVSPDVKYLNNPGFTGLGMCGYTVKDTFNNIGNAVYEIVVADATAPSTVSDFVGTPAGITSPPINVALNDVDAEMNLDPTTVTIHASNAPIGGSCAVTTAPNIEYTPLATFTGNDTCVYEICDNIGNCTTENLDIQVTDSDSPNAVNDTATTTSGGTGVTVDVSGNDSDVQGNLDDTSVTLSFEVGGTCAFDTSSPDVKFTPNSGFIGTGTCGYQICDTSGNCSNAVINVTVLDSVAPVLSGDSVITNAGTDSIPINVSSNDSDPENNMDISSVSISTPASNGTCTISPSSPLVVYSPNPGFSGTDSCSYDMCDNAGNCSTANIDITVNDGNPPSVVNDTSSVNTSVATVTEDVLVNDSDAEGPLDLGSLSVSTQTGGMCTVAAPDLTFVPATGFLGTASCQYTICDTSTPANCSNGVWTITVVDDVAPNVDDNISITNSGTASIPVNVSDNDIDPENNIDLSSVVVSTAASNGTCALSPSSPLIVYTPNPGFSGSDTCAYDICDNAGNCSTANVNITVSDSTPPTLLDDAVAMTTSMGNVTADVLGNDSDTEGPLDTSTFNVTTQIGGSCVAAAPDITFTPAPGFVGLASCTYSICDGSGNCPSAVLEITVTDNVPPAAGNDSVVTASGSTSPAVDVSGTDTDDVGVDISSVSILTTPAPVGGTCAISTVSPLIEFTPNPMFSGAGSCDYQICDFSGNCSSATLNVTVSDGTPPVLVDDATSMSTSAGSVTHNVLGNDSDAEGPLDTATLTSTIQVGGNCAVSAPDSLIYTPNPGFTGSGSCGYTVCDLAGNCSSAVLTITIADDTAPIANDDTASTNSNTASGAINVAANDLDPQNQLDLSSVSVLASGSGGVCTASSSPFVVYTPNPGFSGADTCSYQICDTSGNCSSATINVLVTDTNPPVVTDNASSTTQNNPTAAINVLADDNDPEGNLTPATLSIVTGTEQNGTCSVSSPNVVLTPAANFAGIATCDYQVCDANNNCSVAKITVTVNDVIQPTVTIDQAASTVQADPTNSLPIVYNIVFSEPIDPATFNVGSINTSLSTASGIVLSLSNSGDDTNFTLFVQNLTSNGTVEFSIDANQLQDKNGQNNIASSSTDNVVLYDAQAPTGLEINAFNWSMSSPNDGDISQDGTPQIALSTAVTEDGGTVQVYEDNVCLQAAGSSQVILGGNASFTDISYATDGTADGEKIYYVTITDAVGNVSGCTPIGLDYTLDTIAPSLTIEQVATQADPTGSEPIAFAVSFSEAIDPATFTAADIVNNGTSTGGTWNIGSSPDGQNFQISYTGIVTDGTIIPTIAAAMVQDFAGNDNTASSSVDNVVTYDFTAPTVNITSTPTITTVNDQAWPISGTCSEPGRPVDIILNPGGFPGNIVPLTPVICQPGNTWSVIMDTRSLTLDGSYPLEVHHSDAVGLTATSNTTAYKLDNCVTPPGDITDLRAANVTQQTVDLFWSVPVPGTAAINDYFVEYRNPAQTSMWIQYPLTPGGNNDITVFSLNTSTEYEMRVRAVDVDGCTANYSNIVTVLTKPNHPFFDSFDYELINLAGATQSRVSAFENGTIVDVYDSYADYDIDNPSQTINLNAGEIALINPSFKGQILQSEKPIYATGEISLGSSRGNTQWVPPIWAERTLLTNFVRNGSFPAVVEVYNFESGADINLYEGATLIDSAINVPADTIVTLSVANDPGATVINLNGINAVERSFKLESNGFIVAHGYMNRNGNQVLDDMPFLPSSQKLLGVPSRAGFIGTSQTSPVNLTAYHSDGTVQGNIIDNTCTDTGNPLSFAAGSALSIMPFSSGSCTTNSTLWRDFKPEVVFIDADGPVAGNNVADANGGNAAPFVPVELFKRRYMIPHKAGWVALASDRPAAIQEINQAGVIVATHVLARTGAGPFDPKTPYRIYFTNVDRGTRFEGIGSADVFVGWYQGTGDGGDPLGSQVGYENSDETVLYGYD